MVTDPGQNLRVHSTPIGALPRAYTQFARQRRVRNRKRLVLTALSTLALGVVVGNVITWTRPAPTSATTVPVNLLCSCEATTVGVAGSWNGWDPAQAPMERVSDGLFRATVYLPDGHHEYMFVLNGTDWVTDPAAGSWHNDGFGRRNAVLEL